MKEAKLPVLDVMGKGVGEAVKFVDSKPAWLVIPLTQRMKTRLPDGRGGSQHLRVGKQQPDFLVYHLLYRQATSSSHRSTAEATVCAEQTKMHELRLIYFSEHVLEKREEDSFGCGALCPQLPSPASPPTTRFSSVGLWCPSLPTSHWKSSPHSLPKFCRVNGSM